jgi:hypothetical protein
MDDIISRDDEKGRELAKEKGKIDEQNRQRERELATEKGRKQGVGEERARETQKKGLGTGMTIVISLVVLALILGVAALLTLSVSVSNVSAGTPLSFTTNYGVTFPEGQPISMGNSQITVLSYQNELISDIDGDRQKLVEGENRVITERRAVISSLGVITLVDTHFQVDLKYKGNRDNQAYFDMAIHTSQQVPDMLLKKLLPPEINAQPI